MEEREEMIQISFMTLFLIQNMKILSWAELLSFIDRYPGRKLSGSKVFSGCGSTGAGRVISHL